MRKIRWVLIFAILLQASAFAGEMVVFDKRYFVSRNAIVGELYSNGGKQDNIRVQISLNYNGMLEKKFICQDKWNWKKVMDATVKIKDFINKNDYIEPVAMFEKAGLSGCEYE